TELVRVPESTVHRVHVHAAEVTDSASNWCGAFAGGNEDDRLHRSRRVGRLSSGHEGRDKATRRGGGRAPHGGGFHEAQADVPAGVDVDGRLERVGIVAEADAANVRAAAHHLKSGGGAAHVDSIPLSDEFAREEETEDGATAGGAGHRAVNSHQARIA